MLNIIEPALICIIAIVYTWILYNVPILAAGIKNLHRSKQQSPHHQNSAKRTALPSFSIIIPVKNEENVIRRLLQAIGNLNYPQNKTEIIIVEDGSTDHTIDVCTHFAKTYNNAKVLHQLTSNGKPSALNYGLKHAKGEIVAIFDADNVPAKDALLKAAAYFEKSAVGAVQGRTLSINSQENMLTQFISYEEAVWCEAYLRGKDSLDLFVHFKGSCQFIRRHILQQLAGFDENALSEDMELSARLTENGYNIRYGGDVCAWQESPSNLKMLFKQRTRWLRGTMEVAFKYGRLMAKPNRKNLDAEATLFGPFIIVASLLSYLAGSGAFFAAFPFDVIWRAFMYFSISATTFLLFLCGFALMYVSKPKRAKNLLWLPFVFAYWYLQSFIALYALALILLRRPKKWLKTEKKGIFTDATFGLENGTRACLKP